MKTKDEILRKMTLKDKARLFTGLNSWELEAIEGKNIFLSDGPHGVRKEIQDGEKKETVKAVCYPAACLSACSFDEELFDRYGKELAKECIHNDVDVLLGPGINIKRNPRCGRNFEYFSEDPFLSGKLASAWINGVQSRNVGVSLKHFALNSQEEARLVNNSIADEKALREIYIKAFEIAIRESHPWTVMASYNKIDGVHATENRKLLTEILRKELGFDGIVVSDWGAVEHPVESLEAGLDLEMPGLGKGSAKRILDAIEKGETRAEVLEESTARLVDLYQRTMGEKTDDFAPQHALDVAREIAEKSIVLLKNEECILPLREDQNILIVGDFAEHPRYQGGGSSEINPLWEESLITAMKEAGIRHQFVRGYFTDNLEPDEALIAEACSEAKDKDVVVVMCGLPRSLESEGYDRANMEMPASHVELINRLSKVNPNIVVVLQNGSPIMMPFLPEVKAVVETYLGGSKHGEAIRNILYGKVNPSGRLAETFPLSYSDVPSATWYLENEKYSLYKESIYVGYRYYDKARKDVLFPFGYGLSYSETEWSAPLIKHVGDKVDIEVNVRNIGRYPTRETVEIYGGLLSDNKFRADKELKAFKKVELEVGEEKTVDISFPLKDLSVWSLSKRKWVLESGRYRIYVARHSRDEELYGDIIVDGETMDDVYPECYGNLEAKPADKEFFSLLDKEPNLEFSVKPFTGETTLGELQHTFLGKVVLKPILRKICEGESDPNNRKMFEKAIPTQPIRSIQMMFPFSKTAIEGIVDIFNGHLIRGIRKLKEEDEI